MAELPDTMSEYYTHFQRCDVTIANTTESNYAALQKSDLGVADLSATRALHATDAKLPEAVRW
jgi:hypothetical protein